MGGAEGWESRLGRPRGPNRVGTDKIDYEKSPYLFPFTRVGARRLAIAAGAAGCRLRFVQDVLRYAVVRLSGLYHDQRRPGVRDRKGRVALLCKRLFHRNGHGRRAVDFHYALLHVRDAPVRLLGRRRSMEGEPAAEPVCRPDLGGYPLHDAGGAAPQIELDVPQDPGAGDFRRPGHHPADDSPANSDDRPSMADVRRRGDRDAVATCGRTGNRSCSTPSSFLHLRRGFTRSPLRCSASRAAFISRCSCPPSCWA